MARYSVTSRPCGPSAGWHLRHDAAYRGAGGCDLLKAAHHGPSSRPQPDPAGADTGGSDQVWEPATRVAPPAALTWATAFRFRYRPERLSRAHPSRRSWPSWS